MNTILRQSVLALSLIISISNLSANPRERKPRNNVKKTYSFKIDSEFINSRRVRTKDSMKCLALMIEDINVEDNEFSFNYISGEYEQVESWEYENSDSFFARILYPMFRNPEEYAGYITDFLSKPKAHYIYFKSKLGLANWDDLIYMLKIMRPYISNRQLNGLKKRQYLLKKPLKDFGTSSININESEYIQTLLYKAQRITGKKVFTVENFKIVKAIALDSVATGLKRAAVVGVDQYMNKKQISDNLEKAVDTILAKKVNGKTKRK